MQKQKLAEIWLDEAGNPQLKFPKNVDLRLMEASLGNLLFLVMEMRIKAELKMQSSSRIFDPFTGKPILKKTGMN